MCAARAVSEYIRAAEDIGWDLSAGYLFSDPASDGSQGPSKLTPRSMKNALQGHLREAGLPSHFAMHSLRGGSSLSRALAGEAIESTMQVGGWKTESATVCWKCARTYNAATTRPGCRRRSRQTSRLVLADRPYSRG